MLACPFGVPRVYPKLDQMMKCDMCYDRTATGPRLMCVTVCPSRTVSSPSDKRVHTSDVRSSISKRTQRLECPCDEGSFDCTTGRVISGPPPRPLPVIAVEVRGEEVWALGLQVPA